MSAWALKISASQKSVYLKTGVFLALSISIESEAATYENFASSSVLYRAHIVVETNLNEISNKKDTLFDLTWVKFIYSYKQWQLNKFI